MPRRSHYDYQYRLVQSVWDDTKNNTKLVPDLNELASLGYRIMKIVPREKDFFDIFFERKILSDVRQQINDREGHSDSGL